MTKFGAVFLVILAVGAGWSAMAPSPAPESSSESRAAWNERLTALSGAPLYILLIAIGITILYIQPLRLWHYLVGFLLIPPVLLKMASSGNRFVRYYTGEQAYRLAGPPSDLQRFIVAPVLVVSTVLVFVSGVELWLVGFRFGSTWLDVHTASSVAMILSAGTHVLAHLRRSAAVTVNAIAGRTREAFAARSLVLASLLIGAALAAASLLNSRPFPVS